MARIHPISSSPIHEETLVAVALHATDLTGHIGVVYRYHQATRILHLAFHQKLSDQDLRASGFRVWVDPALPPSRGRWVAAFCRRVWKTHRYRGIPYAFSHPNHCFDFARGAYLFGPRRHGLTCSTFVLAVFSHMRVHFIDYKANWPVRPEDELDQAKLVEILKKTGADPEHVETVSKEIGSVRYSPEDVGGAASVYPPPATFERAQEAARAVRTVIADTT